MGAKPTKTAKAKAVPSTATVIDKPKAATPVKAKSAKPSAPKR